MTDAAAGQALGGGRLATVRPAVRFAVAGRRLALAGMGATAFLGGVAEALFLILVTRTTLALTGDSQDISFGPDWSLSVDQSLTVALGLVLLRWGFGSAALWQAATVSTGAVAAMRHRLARAFLDASWEVQAQQRSGSLQELLTGYTAQANGLVISVAQTVVAAANLTALVGTAVVVDPLGAVVLVVSVSVLGVLLRPLRRVVRRRANVLREAGMEFATSVSDLSQLGLELHVFGVQRSALRVVSNLIESAREKNRSLQFAAGMATPIYTALAYLALLGALATVAAAATGSLSALGAAMLVMLRSLSYGQSLQSAQSSISSSAPVIDELQRRLTVFEHARRHDGAQPVGRVGTLEAAKVSFAYTPGQDVLRDVSFTIELREIVGIVGPSGSGKSTLVQLLLGLRDPDRGRILAGGRNLGDLAKAELARKITFVPQAAHLIAGTIADNIRFLREGVSQEDIERAARLAHLHEDVMGLLEGYERQVGEHGGHLSGGQQQRLCIARALVEDPDVLIMDEPTSALDVRSEHLIRTTLVGLKERMTVIIIAHRLSTLDMCDRIMVIQDGELKGFDTPAALEASSDFFREALVLSGLR